MSTPCTRMGDGNVDRVAYVTSTLISASNGAATAKTDEDDGGGILCLAGRHLGRGDLILTCPAACIAIDPPHRRSRCAFCAFPTDSSAQDKTSQTTTVGDSSLCHDCGIVAICDRCQSAGAGKWHVQSGECHSLKLLVRSFCHLFGVSGGREDCADVSELAQEVDSSFVLTIRLLHRRWNDDRKLSEVSPLLPPVDWKLFDMLHTAKFFDSPSKRETLHDETPVSKEESHYDAAVTALCKLMNSSFEGNAKGDQSLRIEKDSFNDALGKITGCCHAITDVTLGLGCQCLGRALFLNHSFYNHACNPNAFLSCYMGGAKDILFESSRNMGTEPNEQKRHLCALFARVHCLADMDKGAPIALSYIPTSGLDRTERQRLLLEGYHFECACRACRIEEGDAPAIAWERQLKVPEGSDLNSLREVQHSCNQRILSYQENDTKQDLGSVLGMIRMTQTGIKNQRIGEAHEVCIEAHRLLAAALSISGKASEAIEHHELGLGLIARIIDLFDPVAAATQRLEFAGDLGRVGNYEEGKKQLNCAMEYSSVALGEDHPFVVSIRNRIVEVHELSKQKKRKLDMNPNDRDQSLF